MSARSVGVVQSRVEVLGLAAEARELAAREGLDARQSSELSLVIAELAMNALRHGGGGGLVSVSVSPLGWSVEVEDAGPGLSPAVMADAGRSDRLGAQGVRPPNDGQSSFGSGLASVRRLSSRLELSNRRTGGAHVAAHRDFPQSLSQPEGSTA